MIESLAVLLLFQLLGEITVQFSGAPVPGPVLGMVFLALVLSLRGGVPERLRQHCQDLLAHLPLLFVPAGVGVMLHLERIAAEWLPLLTALLLGTWLTLVVTAGVMDWVMDWQNSRKQPGHAIDENASCDEEAS